MMRRSEVEGFDAARYISEHNTDGEYGAEEAVSYPLYSQRSLEDEPVSVPQAASRPVGYVEPNYGQPSPYQKQLSYTSGARPPTQPATASMVYYYDPDTQTYVATTAPPPSLSASMRGAPPGARIMKKVMMPPGQPPPSSPAMAPPAQVAVGGPTDSGASRFNAEQPTATMPQSAMTAQGNYVLPASRKEVAEWSGSNKWVVSSSSACCRAPCVCLGACFCPVCMVASQRGDLLGKNWSFYRCCAGVCGPRDCCSEDCGRCGMCCEACFCCSCSLHGNRYMLQRRYNLERSCCDRCVASAGCCCNDTQSCWSWCCGGLCDCWYTCAFPCLLTQQYCQMKAMTQLPTSAVMQ